MRKVMLILALLLLAATLNISDGGQAQGNKLLLRQPAMNKTNIVFVYAGDLWIAPRAGGEAARLTTGVGAETAPQFSPDGTTIAFTGMYDGNVDVYTVPVTGGVPRRLTYHPDADQFAGWTPDGQNVLFVSGRSSDSGRFGRLFTLPVNGTFPAQVPLPMAHGGAYSPDGTRLAYEPVPRAFNAWKRYRGGQASYLWLANLSDSSTEAIPRDKSNDFNAMWPAWGNADKVYFLSDRNGPVTLFAYDTKTKKVEQQLANNGLDIKWASASLVGGGDAIVYEQFGAINIFDLKSRKATPVNITISGDLPGVRAKFEKVGPRIFDAAISPTGARAIFEARGEILSVPAEKGDVRNLTNTVGVAERDPAWSPDGKWIAYFSEASGEYELHLRDQKGVGEVKKIKLEPSFYYSPLWSPDSQKIAFSDKRLNIWYVDIEKGQPVKVDTLTRGFAPNKSWSPDSRWLTFTKPLPSWYNAVFVYALEDGKATQITDGLSDAATPVFDKSGKYLYFSASTDIGPRVFGFDMSSYPHRPTRSVYVAVLKKSDPSPLAPESDEEKVADSTGSGSDRAPEGEKKPEAASAATAAAAKPGDKKEPVNVAIDFDNISQRVLALPIPARNIVGLVEGKASTLYVIEFADGSPGATVHKFDLEKRKLDKALEGVAAFDVSANGEKFLYRQGQNWFIAATATLGTPGFKPGDGKLKTEEMEVYVDPQAEWQQMYRETWRIERDFFYDPGLHGMDFKAMEQKYAPYVAGLGHRADLNYLFQEMLGELSVGHLYVNGGDMPNPNLVPGGLLGADYTIENGRYRFAKVYNGENWNPNLRAPLTQPGVNVVAGEYLLAVNGRNLTAAAAGGDNLYSFFEGKSGKQVVLKVGPNADGTGARDVTVVPTGNEGGLRNLAWIEDNRRKVAEMSGGKLSYVYLPDTAGGGYTNFNRYFFPQLDKQGVVVDERFNSGGQAADYVIDYLSKPLMSYWAVRDGGDWRQPFGTMAGPKVMLTNEYSGSGGDYLPYMFRRAKLGPLMGKRTWGGLVGIGGYPVLMDGGSVTAPHFAFYTPEGQWDIENRGVAPDVEVDLNPKAWREGRDTQLERAVNYLLDELKKNPPKPEPKRPPYPNYHKQPLPAAGNGSGN